MTDPENNIPLKLARHLVLLCCALLIAIYSIDTFVISAQSNISFWVIKILPLIALFPALKSNNLRSYQWLCFLIMIYFMQGVLDVFSPEKKIQGFMETGFTLLLFCSAVFFVHGSQKAIKLKLAQDQG